MQRSRRPLGALVLPAALACALLLPSAASGQAIEGSYIVVYKRTVSNPSAETTARERRLGFDSRRRFRRAVKGFAATLTPGQLRGLRADPEVDFVTPNRRVHATTYVPLAAGDTTPFGVRRMLAGTATQAQVSGANVAVIDTGIDLDHPDLNAADGTDCISPGTPAEDDEGHGTHVAGTISARNDGAGVVGVAPGTKTYAVKVLDSSGSGTTASVVCGIDWVASHSASLGIKVANMSLGGTGEPFGTCGSTSDAEFQAICNATAAGVNFVVAAGNEGYDYDFAPEPDVPAAYPNVLTVTAVSDSDGVPGGTGAGPACWSTQPDDGPASFSNFAATAGGTAHTIAAPGVCIRSTVPGGGYGTLSGTSMASPHMAGIVALCMAEGATAGPCAALAPSQVVSYLREQAQAYNGANPGYGFDGDPAAPADGAYFGFLQGPLDELGPPPPPHVTSSGSAAAPAPRPTARRTLAKADLTRAKRSIRVRRGRFAYSFRAPAGAAGEAAFASAGKVRVSARRKITLARRSFAVGRSGKVTLRIKLSRKSLRVLRRNRRIKLVVAVRLEDAAGLKSRATRTLTLRI